MHHFTTICYLCCTNDTENHMSGRNMASNYRDIAPHFYTTFDICVQYPSRKACPHNSDASNFGIGPNAQQWGATDRDNSNCERNRTHLDHSAVYSQNHNGPRPTRFNQNQLWLDYLYARSNLTHWCTSLGQRNYVTSTWTSTGDGVSVREK